MGVLLMRVYATWPSPGPDVGAAKAWDFRPAASAALAMILELILTPCSVWPTSLKPITGAGGFLTATFGAALGLPFDETFFKSFLGLPFLRRTDVLRDLKDFVFEDDETFGFFLDFFLDFFLAIEHHENRPN